MIRNSSNEELEVFIVYARPFLKTNESINNLLSGDWFVQTIGDPAEGLKISLACKWDVVQQLMALAISKELLTVSYLGFQKTAFIAGMPSYDIAERHETNPVYKMEFEMVVISSV